MKRTEGHETYSRKDVYQLITDRVIEALERGTIPWRKPWQGGAAGAPMNLISRKPYRGVNVFILASAGYGSPYWLTFKQARELGGHVRKGEKGTPIVFWKWLDRRGAEDGEGEAESTDRRQVAYLRYFTVFNVEQCEGLNKRLPATEEKTPAVEPIAAAQAVIDGMPRKPQILHGGDMAYYAKGPDIVKCPKPESFETPAHYYATLFHELAHSTGHADRLNRPTVEDACVFGSTNYSKEELVAEMAAAFLCAMSSIENVTLGNQSAYIAGWLHRLQDDRKLVVQAAAQAQHAADFILGEQAPAVADETETAETVAA
jgi:antirestriction protein ArdC